MSLIVDIPSQVTQLAKNDAKVDYEIGNVAQMVARSDITNSHAVENNKMKAKFPKCKKPMKLKPKARPGRGLEN